MKINLLIKCVVCLCSLLALPVQAASYDDLLLKAQATIFPKIVLLDKEIAQKAVDNKILITIVYSQGDFSVAQQLHDLIRAKYQNRLGRYELEVTLQPFAQVENEVLATAYFVLSGGSGLVKSFSDYAAAQQRLVFSYDYRDFKNNALLSVLLKEKTYIYLNKQSIDSYNVKFVPMFYKVVKLFE